MDALDMLANNLSNLNTTGFKAQKSFFSVLNDSMQPSESDAPDTSAADRLVIARGALSMTDGTLMTTQRDMDLALIGDGFFVVSTPRGTRYTRNGNFAVNKKSQICMADGSPILGQNGPISVPAGKLSVTEKGEVYLDGKPIDQLKIQTFDVPALMVSEGNSLLAPPNAQAAPKPARAIVRQGALEQSNVNPVGSVVEMVGLMRRYEAIQKTVSLTLNNLDSKSIEKLGR
jgi:flagellar basal body rod protein FlgG